MSVDTQHGPQSAGSQKYALSKRYDLQGMRAFAVLTVFANHLLGWPSGGFVGVDVFFVLSGFFITGLLIQERTKTGHISFRSFYIRRVRRIIPSATLVIVVTVIGSFILLTATRAKETLIDGLWAAIFLSNWRFERVGTDYFAEGQPDSPLLHYWSLSIEEQFYFVWPLLLLGLFTLTRRYSTQTEKYRPKRQAWLAGFMGTICVASFAWACIQINSNPASAYFSTLTRVWELGIGAMLAICVPLLTRIPDGIRPALSYIGLAGAIASLFLITPATPFPGPWTALPVLSTALVIAAFVGSPARAVPHLTNPVSQYVGEVSYTMYLWHWPVIILLAAVLPPELPYFIACIALTLVLTAVTYRFYENPIRHSDWLEDDTRLLPAAPKTWATLGVVLAAAIVASAVTLEVADSRSAGSQSNQQLVVAADAPTFEQTRRCFGAAALTTEGCTVFDANEPVYPGSDAFADDTQGAYECYRKAGEPVESCSYGYEGPDAKRIAVVGDSHAAMLLPGLAQHLIDNKWNLTPFVGEGCQWQIGGGGDCAETVMPQVQQQLLNDKFDAVVTTAGRTLGGSVAEYVAAWQPVADAGSKILVVADNPTVSPETLACVTRVGGNVSECATPRDVALAEKDPLLAAAEQVPAVTVLDMTSSFCDEQKCPAVIGNVYVYRDASSHMTATYVQSLSPQLVEAIEGLLA